MAQANPTLRFSSRVDNYIRHRPGYPADVLETMRTECGLTPAAVVADIACGTGIFTRLLLENGNRVIGVEPNQAMREASEKLLSGYPNFRAVAGSAEESTLPDHSVDFATAAQAAHWFDLPRARREFCRILKGGGWTTLIWNERSTDTTPFLRAYEDLLLTYGTDYQQIRHEHTTDNISSFFAPSPFSQSVFGTQQDFDYAELEGRLLSSSYAPLADHPNHAPMLQELRRIFDAHQEHGRVSMEYRTRMYYGQLA